MGLNLKNLCLCLLGIMLSVAAEAARPVALILQTRDESRGLFYAQDLKSLLKHQLPGHDVVVVDSWNQDPEKNRLQLKAALRAFQSDGLITHLYLLTPTESATVIENGSLYSTELNLYGVGSISPVDGVDRNFVDTLIPLRGKLADNAQIVFDACGKSCGSEDFTQDLALRLADFFQIPNGTVTAVLAPNSNSVPVSKGVLVQRKTLIYTVLAGFVTATLATPVIVETSSVMEFLSTWAAFTGASSLFALPVTTVTDIVKRTFAEMKKKTVEVAFTNGAAEIKSNNTLSLFGKMGASCKKLVTPNRNRMEGPFP